MPAPTAATKAPKFTTRLEKQYRKIIDDLIEAVSDTDYDSRECARRSAIDKLEILDEIL